MPTLPTNPHYVGDSGHVNDHNLIVSALESAPYGFGKVLQVVHQPYSTEAISSSNTFIDTGLTKTITPSSTSSKILVIVTQAGVFKYTGNTYVQLRLLRGSTNLTTFEVEGAYTNSTAANNIGSSCCIYLDAPATTSATTYKTQFCSGANIASVRVQTSGATSNIVLLEIGP